MERTPVIMIFDIGRTNKKMLVFDRDYQVLRSEFFDLPQTVDAGGYLTEDLDALTARIWQELRQVLDDDAFELRALNVTTYGATIVNTDDQGRPVHPVLDYLRPLDPLIQQRFDVLHDTNGNAYAESASPELGNLNTGMQLFALKQADDPVFQRIRHSTWLPQYLSSRFTGRLFSEYTSIGCHTMCWDFRNMDYHAWTKNEGIAGLFPPIRPAAEPVTIDIDGRRIVAGIGMHDSSSALLPYLRSMTEPFMLLSTGSWNICMNPFNDAPLTADELAQDCLCYLTYEGRPVKSSRLNAGFQHAEAVASLSRRFGNPKDFYLGLGWDPDMADRATATLSHDGSPDPSGECSTPSEAYYAFLARLVATQSEKIRLVASSHVQQLFIDGGFSRNVIFMELLRRELPSLRIAAAEVGQATALGAAMVLHEHWNEKTLRKDLVRFL
jgi:sugar (pentulose or hexulose) kinase